MPKLLSRIARKIAAIGLACAGATSCTPSDVSVAADVAPTASALDALQRLPAPARRDAPRLSLAQRYRTCARDDATLLGAAGRCAAGARATAPPPGLATAVAAASARARTRLDTDALYALALADLAWGDAARNALDRSISTLRTVAGLSARPAPPLADLAAALLVRFEQSHEPHDLLEAAEVADRALAADPDAPAARFNLALALERIGLDVQASRAWEAYLRVDSTSGWASEVRRVQARRTAAASSKSRGAGPTLDAQAARAAILDTLLGAWGDAELRGDDRRAASALGRAAALGTLLTRAPGDASAGDAVRGVQSARGRAAVRALAQAHRSYSAGRAAFEAGNFATAVRAFRRAAAGTNPGATASPLHAWAATAVAASLVQRGHSADAERMSRRLVQAVDSARYPALAARARWVGGSALLRTGRLEEALALLRSATVLFERAGEQENTGAVLLLAADAEFGAGDRAAAYRQLHRALSKLRHYRGSVWLHNLLYIWSDAASDEFPRTAARLQDEGIVAAEATGASVFVVEARLARARLATSAGEAARAAREVEEAGLVIARMPAGPDRDWLHADLQLLDAAVATLRGEPHRASRVLDVVVPVLKRSGNPARLVPALVARADARLSGGDRRGAQADLDDAVSVVQRLRDRTESARLRAAMADGAQRTVDRLVMSRVAEGRVTEALLYMERARASSSPAHGRRAAAVVPVMPPGSVGLQIAFIGDTLLVWTVDGSRVELARSTVSRAMLVGTIARVRSALEARAGAAEVGPDLAALYDVILRPVRSHLEPASRLVIAADGEIAGVPLAALYDTTAGRYVIERHTLLFAPRLGSEAETRHDDPPRGALLVADPVFDPVAFPGLARLPEARAEVDAIVPLYRFAHVLNGSAADRARVTAALAAVDVAHYAGHAVFDDVRPDQSYLILARTRASEPARLTAAEIEQLSLKHLRLLVLSACETGRPAPGRSGGFSGLTGAFLAAGAGGVVGTLWRVQDALTRPLMVDFHRAYRQHGDGADALRRAQLKALGAQDLARRAPAAWAGFRYTTR